MALHMRFLHKLKRLFSGKRRFAAISLTLMILFLFFLFYQHSSFEDENVYHIGMDNRWKDLQLYGREINFSAFSQDILAAISKEEQIRFKLMHARGNELEQRVLDGEYDAIMTGMKVTEVRQRTLEFSDPYYVLGPVLTVAIHTQMEGWNEFARKVIGVYAFSPTILELQKDHGMQLKYYEDIKRALADLSEHKIDGVIFPALPSLIYTKTFYHDRLKVVTPPIDDEGVHLVTLKNERGSKLVEQFNRGLNVIKKNGVYDELLTRWGLFDAENLDD